MADVFISYCHSSPDRELATRLAAYLAAHAVAYFIDAEIHPGQRWVNIIEGELQNCTHVIVLLSPESIRSDMVRKEVALAHEYRKQILPIRIAFDGALPYDLGAYLDPIQHLTWHESVPFESVCARILGNLSSGPPGTNFELLPNSVPHPEAKELSGAPLPYADPRLETGALQLDSPFYIRRSADSKVEYLVDRPGETILIKGPRQVGKTSLAARARNEAKRNGRGSCYVDLQLLDESRLRDYKALLNYLAACLAREFKTLLKPKDVWDDLMGDADSLTEFIERAVLVMDAPVLVCLDEVDNIFKYSYRDDFFGLLRVWHNRRATTPIWTRFNLLIVHSTEPALFIRDLNQSPFNVGASIRLGDFTREEILLLNQRHGSPLKTSAEIDRLISLLGGHPYLVRQALYTMKSRNFTIAGLESVANEDDGPFGDHLRRQLWALRNSEALTKALKLSLKGLPLDSEESFQRLRAGGLILGTSRQNAGPRCHLYSAYFEKHL